MDMLGSGRSFLKGVFPIVSPQNGVYGELVFIISRYLRQFLSHCNKLLNFYKFSDAQKHCQNIILCNVNKTKYYSRAKFILMIWLSWQTIKFNTLPSSSRKNYLKFIQVS